jgi:hypothetical protein
LSDEEKKDAPKTAEGGTGKTHLTGHFELDFPKTDDGTSESEKQKKTLKSRFLNDLQKPRFYLEVAALLVVVAYTTFAGYQSCKMREANGLTRTQFQSSERPWLGVGGVTTVHDLQYGSSMVASLPMMNTGRTPALYTISSAVLFPQFIVGTDSKQLPMPLPEACLKPVRQWSDTLEGQIVIPGGTAYLTLTSEILPNWAVDAALAIPQNRKPLATPLPTPLPQFLLTPPTAKMESLGMVAVGCSEYFDIWHNPHRTVFCTSFNPILRAFGPCDVGNSAN